MTAIGYVVGSMVVTLAPGTDAAVEYQCAITGVVEGESHTDVTTQVACPDGVKTQSGPSSWTVTVSYNVSLLPDSFHRIIRENPGVDATFVVEPFPDAEPGHKISYDVTLTGGAGNFTVGAYGVASATFPCKSAPAFVDGP